MKIKVSYELCESNAICCRACPDVFSIDENDELVLATETPSEELREKVERAARGCPKGALTIEG